MKLINDNQAKANIIELRTTGAKQDKLIHETGLYAINQANQHGNTNSMNDLVRALNKSARKEALYAWLRDHAKVVKLTTGLMEYRKDKKLFDKLDGILVEITTEKALELAEFVPFWDYTKEATPATKTDALEQLNNLINRLTNFKGTVEHKEVIANLKFIYDTAKAGDVIELVETQAA
jgi:hypothetical protein